MPKRPASLQIGFFVALLPLAFGLSSCVLPKPVPPGGSKNRAFISYQPAPKNDTALRLAVKDLIDIKGTVTSAGSEHLFKNNPPAKRDAACLAIARERNVRIVGKANLTEFAMGTSGLNSYFGTPQNPRVKKGKYIPGGSSSGSAVAVATDMADVAFGSDTAGSIRVPAAFCGIVGLKTTFGLVSLKGVYPLSQHLDTIGPMAKDIDRLAQGMDLLERGFAAKYERAKAAAPDARKIRIGRLYLEGTDPKIDQAIDAALAAKGFQIVILNETFRDQWKQAQRDGDLVAVVDGWRTNGKYGMELGISLNTRAALALGRVQYPGPYTQALSRRAAWRRTLNRTLAKVDFIALPTMQVLPPRMPFLQRASALFEANLLLRQNTVPASFAGNPALAMPVPLLEKKSLPTSLQLIGPKFSEAKLMNAGRLIESKVR